MYKIQELFMQSFENEDEEMEKVMKNTSSVEAGQCSC